MKIHTGFRRKTNKYFAVLSWTNPLNGYGDTKQEAIDDLLSQIEEKDLDKETEAKWLNWLQDDHVQHQDDDRQELWEKFMGELQLEVV